MLRTQITLGILLMIVTVGTFAYIGATEEERMATATDAQLARRIENGAFLYHNNCARCHGERAEGVPGLCPALNSISIFEQRVKDTGWSGSVHSFLVNTIRGGRLKSTRPDQYIGESANGMAMPFWSQDYGGPLRNDQIEDIAHFLENFGEMEIVAGPTPTPIDVNDLNALVIGGYEIYEAQGCIACHQLDSIGANGQTGPTHNGMGLIAAQRIEDPNYTGEATTPAEYIRESIVNSGGHIVDGYQNVMPSYGSLPDDQIEALVQMLLQEQ